MSSSTIPTMTTIIESPAASNTASLSSYVRNRDRPVALTREVERYPHHYPETAPQSPSSLPSRRSSAGSSEPESSQNITASYGTSSSRPTAALVLTQDAVRSLPVHSSSSSHARQDARAHPPCVRKRSSCNSDADEGTTAAADRGSHDTALASATPPLPHRRNISADSSSTSNICLCQPDPKIPRPRNAFILYRQHHQAAITSKNPSLSNPEISKVLGEQWKAEPPEVKKDWKNLAEEEKNRHQQQYPEYRYQPRRTRRGSAADSAFGSLPSICNKCGNRTMVSPTTGQSQSSSSSATSTVTPSTTSASLKSEAPATASIPTPASQPPRPILPPPHQTMSAAPHAATSPLTNQRLLPPMKSLSRAASQNLRKPNRSLPPNIGVMSHNGFQEYQEDGRYSQLSPEAKRRRFNGGYTPVTTTAPPPQTASRPTAGNPYGPMISPYRDGFVRNPMDDAHRYSRQHPSTLMPPPSARSSVAYPLTGDSHDSSLTLPPIKDALEARKSVEAMHMSIPYIGKIRILGKISPPYTQPIAPGQNQGRGAILAIEGDDAQATSEITNWLGRYLSSNEHVSCRVAQGPSVPEDGKQVSISDYYTVISEWHARSKEMIGYVLGMPVAEDSPESMVQANTDSNKRIRSYYEDQSQHARSRNKRESSDTDSDSDSDMEDGRSDGSISPKNTLASSLSQQQQQQQRATSRGRLHSQSRSPSCHNPKKSSPTNDGRHQRNSSDNKPVLILNRYQLHASNGFASSVPINDAYSPVDHWQWMATLWRDIIGPDLTVYVHTNATPEDVAVGPKVEIHEGLRTMVVRKQHGSHVEEKILRRLGFEVSEWVRAMANGETRGGNGSGTGAGGIGGAGGSSSGGGVVPATATATAAAMHHHHHQYHHHHQLHPHEQPTPTSARVNGLTS